MKKILLILACILPCVVFAQNSSQSTVPTFEKPAFKGVAEDQYMLKIHNGQSKIYKVPGYSRERIVNILRAYDAYQKDNEGLSVLSEIGDISRLDIWLQNNIKWQFSIKDGKIKINSYEKKYQYYGKTPAAYVDEVNRAIQSFLNNAFKYEKENLNW